ncbi:hypothetical protein T484DRAFT_1948988 [Baffinella frigidus]|nr:hypothetical protein T484DRAFT_1948988 [Cryptophyta sp. CCMP2293]|eukprot:CAMPEP_0180214502 /NCGR_PEP_ID=MMETSP0987-20121128/14948_1 /TAXON_ID=697907 /ORGANISM="non described non described, Strain CCMP2293" /LENGTH=199 /DNA_ID=CAMNT_0022173001 /DNA_START=33 /DNA_END=632 /DNA_ORIENTATION=-
MVHAAHDDAFEATTRSVGCVSALLPRISAKAWYRKPVKSVPKSKAEHISATHAPLKIDETSDPPVTTWATAWSCRQDGATIVYTRVASFLNGKTVSHTASAGPPFCRRVGSGTAGQNVEKAKTPTVGHSAARAEMRRRFRAANGFEDARPASRSALSDARVTRASSTGSFFAPAQQNAWDSNGARSTPARMRGPPPWQP